MKNSSITLSAKEYEDLVERATKKHKTQPIKSVVVLGCRPTRYDGESCFSCYSLSDDDKVHQFYSRDYITPGTKWTFKD